MLMGMTGVMTAGTTISGTVLGYNGQALPKANIQLVRQGQTRAITSVAAAADGSFSIETDARGLLLLRFSGVGHQIAQVPILLRNANDITLTARLQPYNYDTLYDSVRVIGDFNKFGLDGAQPLTKQPDGTYTAEIDAPGETFSYQLINLAQGLFGVNGTMADDYAYDSRGTYRSIITPKDGKATIVFDPSLLPTADKQVAEIRFGDSLNEQLRAVFDGIAARSASYQRALDAHCRAGKNLATFDYNWAPDITKLTKQIGRSKDTLIRQALMIAYLDLGTHDAKRDLSKAMVAKALDEIPPSSPLWAINPRLITMAIEMTDSVEKYQTYIDAVINDQPDPTVQAPLVYDEMVAARNTNDKDRANKYYERLVTEFVDTPYAGMARFAVMNR